MRRILLAVTAVLFSVGGIAQITADSVPPGMYAADPGVHLSITMCQQNATSWFDINCDSIPDLRVKMYKGITSNDEESYAYLYVLNDTLEICSDTTQYTGPYKRPHYYNMGDTLNCQGGAQWMNDTAYQLAYFGCMLCNGPGTVYNKYVAYRKNAFIGWMKISFFIGSSTSCNVPDTLTISSVLAPCASVQSASCQIVTSYTLESCPGCCDGSASVQLVNGCAPTTYTWVPMGANSSTVHNICSGMVFTVMTNDNGGANCCGAMSQTVSVPSTTSIEKTNEKNDFVIFPNPTSSGFTVKSIIAGRLELCIYDFTGKLIYRKEDWDRKSIDVSVFDNGIYTVAIGSDDGVLIRKLTVLH